MLRLDEIFNALNTIALSQPNIYTTISNDVYRINEYGNVRYGVFSCTQSGQHTEDDEYRYYNLNLFVIDRLLDGGENEISIQSNAIEILHNIIQTFVSEYDVDIYGEVRYQSFQQKFLDECAGVYATVSFQVPLDLCTEEY